MSYSETKQPNHSPNHSPIIINPQRLQKHGLKIITDPKLLLLWFCIIVNILNVGFLWENTYLCFTISCLLLVLILSNDYSKYGVKKCTLVITSLIVAFAGPIIEIIMIYLSNNKCKVYGNIFSPLNISLDLIPNYGLIGVSCIIIYKVLEYLCQKIRVDKPIDRRKTKNIG